MGKLKDFKEEKIHIVNKKDLNKVYISMKRINGNVFWVIFIEIGLDKILVLAQPKSL